MGDFSELAGDPVAIVGMACRLPGAENLDEFWNLISRSEVAIGKLPLSRFQPDLFFDPTEGVPGKSYADIGGIVTDRSWCRDDIQLPNRLLERADHVHLALLDVVCDALCHAGTDLRSLSRSRTGVYVGHARGSLKGANLAYSAHIQELIAELHQSEGFAALLRETRQSVVNGIRQRVRDRYPLDLAAQVNLGAGQAAGLISQTLKLNGPAASVDAACASSLAAMHMAVQALQQNRIQTAIVGGASYSSWTSMVVFSWARALSRHGSFPFDARADGFVSSDGYAAVVLKRLSRAIADGNPVIGVIRGIGLATDGRGKSLWAPRKEGQILAIQRAYQRGVDPSLVQYIEAHGTSTPVGDAIELQALNIALGPHVAPNRIPVSSVKANIGHTRETAGLASVIKILLAMKHEQIPRAASFETPNPDIPWSDLPFYVPTVSQPWLRTTDGTPRRGVVDAFGIGGLNGHVVLDDGHSALENAKRRTSVSVPPQHNAAQADEADAPEPIAVIGMGAVLPGARTIAAVRELFLSGRDPKVSVPTDRWGVAVFDELTDTDRPGSGLVGGFITDFEYDWRKNKIPPVQVKNADPVQFMVLDAAEQALDAACWQSRPFNRERCAVVVGTEFTSDFGIQLTLGMRIPEFRQSLYDVLRECGADEASTEEICEQYCSAYIENCAALHDETGSYTSSTLASRISKTFDLKGGAYAIDAAGCSSMAAFSAAIDQLRAGCCDTVLCAGAQRAMDVIVYGAMEACGRLASSPGELSSEAAASGFVPGEGTVVMLLKRLSDARRDGDQVHGTIHNLAVASNSDSAGDAANDAVRLAIDECSTSPENIAAVHSAGFGIPSIDHAENAGLAASYNVPGRTEAFVVSNVIEQIGYGAGVAGMASTLKMIVTLGEQKPKATTTGNSCYGGINNLDPEGQAYHMIIEAPSKKPADNPEPAAVKINRILRIGAPTKEQLAEKLKQRIGLHQASTAFSSVDRFRLAIVVADAKDVDQKVKLAEHALRDDRALEAAEAQGVFFGEVGDSSPRIAFLFSGQGSQYPGMLLELIGEDPTAAEHLLKINEILVALELPTFQELVDKDSNRLGIDVFDTQLSVLLADVLLARTVASRGLRPDVVSSHSYGEYAALVATNAWTLQDAIAVTQARCRGIDALGADCGTMLATSADRETVETLLDQEDFRDEAFVGNHNAPTQTVVSGTSNAVQRAGNLLEAAGHQVTMLTVPGPFHSPLMKDVRPWIREAIDSVAIYPPQVPLLSSVTNRYAADPIDIRDNLVEQLVGPVEFVKQIGRLVSDGVQIFVEIGPRQVLTRLVKKIVGSSKVAVCSTDQPKSPGSQALLCLQAMMECHGVTGETASTVAASPMATSGHGGPVRRNAAEIPSNAIRHFDATEKRRERNRQNGPDMHRPGATSAASPRTRDAADTRSRTDVSPTDDIDAFLVTFVCEQTGYPPEIVELDADLEADLGIDSIKKAQLLGELREHFPIKPTSDVSLDDFVTLRHIGQFIRDSGIDGVPQELQDTDVSNKTPQIAQLSITVNTEPKNTAPDPKLSEAHEALNVRWFSGSATELGRQHGASEARAIRTTMERFLSVVGNETLKDRQLADALNQGELYFGKDGLEELHGIADAVGVPTEAMMTFNMGLVIPVMQLLPGCTQFVIPAAKNGAEGLVHAVNEDWNLSRILTGAFHRIAQVRTPENGYRCLTFGACGQLGGMNGINEHGLAATSTLLLDRMPVFNKRPGLIHFVVVKRILQQAKTIDEAIDILKDTNRHSAWSMCLSDHKTDRICYLEYDADELEVRWLSGFYGSTNHCKLKQSVRDVEAQSLQRYERMEAMLDQPSLNGSGVRLPVSLAKSILRDQYDAARGRHTTHPTKFTIRQPDTQASIVMRPAEREVWVTADVARPKDADRFHRLSLDELFNRSPSKNCQGPATSTGTSNGSEQGIRPHADRVMNRFVMKMVDARLGKSTEKRSITGRVLLVGQNATADALRNQLTAWGAEVITLTTLDSASNAVAELESLWQVGPIPHLFLLTGRDPEAIFADNRLAWAERSVRGIMLPYLLCQRWTQLMDRDGLTGSGTLVAATALGGSFGQTNHDGAAEGGGLAGLLKAIRHEFEQLQVKIIDLPMHDPASLVARCILGELSKGSTDIEVGYQCGFRRTLRMFPASITAAAECTVAAGGTWIVTGGGRGITSYVARRLAQTFGLRLHLLGSSTVPEIPDEWRKLSSKDRRALRASVTQKARAAGDDPNATWRGVERAIELDDNLREFTNAGVQATYHQCDVRSREELSSVLNLIRQTDSPIRGILHGAGIESACRFDKKEVLVVEATLRAKVDGAIHLIDLTQDDPLGHFVGFGSISGRLGARGQTDYSMASDLLAKVLSNFRRERPECRTVTMHWPAWDDVGMAVRPESRLTLEMAGQKFMPRDEGVAHLLDELRSGSPDPEAMFLDWPVQRPTNGSPYSAAELEQYWLRSEQIAKSPLVRGIFNIQSNKSLTAEVVFDPQTDPFLTEHRLQGVSILPAVVALEAMVESACLLQRERQPVGLYGVEIHRAWRFPEGMTEGGRVHVQRRSNGELTCELQSDYRNRKGIITDPSRCYVSGSVLFDPPVQNPTMEWQEPTVKWQDMQYSSEEERSELNLVWHGPVFQDLRQIAYSRNMLWGRITVPCGDAIRGLSRRGQWLLPSALLDACLQSCSVLTYTRTKTLHLPVGFADLHFFEELVPGTKCTVQVHLVEEGDSHTVFDFGLFSQDQTLLLAAHGYRAAIISAPGEAGS